ncbi:MAG: imidazolonepropionase [Alphaproteobacteria bacterium]
MYDLLFINARIATMASKTVERGALGISKSKIAFIGKMADLDEKSDAKETLDCAGRLLTPALVDCHTHLVFAGDRAGEFEMRLSGKTYEEIAGKGGGIISTVKATRAADEEELAFLVRERALSLMSEGVGTVEIKSGYGLDFDNEIKSLRASAQVEHMLPIKVQRTFLGAHALPPEFSGNQGGYIDFLINELLPVIAKEKLASAVDAYQEKIGFSAAEVSKLFEAAKKHGLAVKLHADQLSDTGGGEVAAKFGALSADHLEYTSEAGVKAMAKAGTAAVLLPGAFYFLNETQKPPVDLFRKHKVDMAIATDCNPGTSPTTSLLLMMNMACTLFGLTPEEALKGVTRNATKALGLENHIGTLEVGKTADIALWDASSEAALSYWIGSNLLDALILDGKPVIA